MQKDIVHHIKTGGQMSEKRNNCSTHVYARVTGFFSSVDRYNPGKKAEMKDRKHFDESVKREKSKDTYVQAR